MTSAETAIAPQPAAPRLNRPPANAFSSILRLGIMERFDVPRLGHNTVPYLHLFAEVTKHAYWCRLKYAGDPEIAPPPMDRLLSFEKSSSMPLFSILDWILSSSIFAMETKSSLVKSEKAMNSSTLLTNSIPNL